MKTLSKLIIVLFIFQGSGCAKLPKTVPTGTWNYRILVNGKPMGHATVSNRIINGNYEISTELVMGYSNFKNIARQIVTESTTFKPIKIESYNKIIDGTKVRDFNTIAEFEGRNITLHVNGKTSRIKLKDDFVLDGNFFITKIIENGFKKGYEVKQNIYDPTIELDRTVPVTTRVEGWKLIDIIGTKKRLMHISQSIDSVKNLASYIDERGIQVKGLVEVLNMKVELLLEEQK